jgi:uncharacterized protein (TIGR04255 family)
MTGSTDGIYRNPPVIEVFCGLVFEPIATLKLLYYGLFWNEFRTEYPLCQHAPPIDTCGENCISNEFNKFECTQDVRPSED